MHNTKYVNSMIMHENPKKLDGWFTSPEVKRKTGPPPCGSRPIGVPILNAWREKKKDTKIRVSFALNWGKTENTRRKNKKKKKKREIHFFPLFELNKIEIGK